MFVVFSSEVNFEPEIQHVKNILAEDKSFNFHVKKPGLTRDELKAWLQCFEVEDQARMVLHQQHDLAKEFNLKGLHLNELHRKNGVVGDYVSTSYHDLQLARTFDEKLAYFFCSPVFESISKKNYSPSVRWNIHHETADFKSKAFALGGINEESLPKAIELGFKNFAVLGAIWNQPNPTKAFQLFCKSWSTNVPFV